MLTAIAKGKIAYSAIREDYLTASVWEPLLLMTPEQAWSILRNSLLRDWAIGQVFRPDSFELEFWPHLQKVEGTGYVEPDLVFFFRSNDKCVVIVLEVKWDAPLGENQLVCQWNAAAEAYRGNEVIHCLLTKKTVSLEQVDHPCKAALLLSTWHNLLSRSNTLIDATNTRVVSTWKFTLAAAMDRLGVLSFSGFYGARKIDTTPALHFIIYRHAFIGFDKSRRRVEPHFVLDWGVSR